MIAEIGQFALVLAFLLALVQGTVPLAGAQRGRAAWMAVAAPAAQAQLVLVALSFGALTWAYVTSDFSVANVAQNSHSAKPMLYKVTGVWGNHEGSMLLWVLILTLFGAALATFGGNLRPSLRARALAVQGLIGGAFLAFILFTSNPFARAVPAPADGNGLNPLLQDPGLAFHPPMLYLGYVGFSMAFAFAVAALIEGRVDAAWARWVRPWTLAAWSALTIGIALGSWWAYYELGWGGWWFWDPVENASFLPWLAGTALLHSAAVVEKRDALKTWTVLLAILAFGLSLIGTFLVRSGVLTSVHTFATDPDRGLFILAILAVAIGGALALYAVRAPAMSGGGMFRPVSREGGLLLNNVLMVVAAATVFLGTLYPLVLDAVGGGKVSVGEPYFNRTFVPLMVPLLLAMAAGPMLAWKRADLGAVLARLRFAIGASLAVALAAWFMSDADAAGAALGMGLAAWIVLGTLAELAERIRLFRAPARDTLARLGGLRRSTWGQVLAHAGVGVLVAGITGSSVWTEESIQYMRTGDTARVAGYDFAFEGVATAQGPNYRATRGTFTVTRGGEPVAVLTPEKRVYPVERNRTTEAAIHTTWLADLYAVLGDRSEEGGWATRIYHNPLVPWIWIGAVIMFAGGAVSLTDRRHRVGAPARRKAAAEPAPA